MENNKSVLHIVEDTKTNTKIHMDWFQNNPYKGGKLQTIVSENPKFIEFIVDYTTKNGEVCGPGNESFNFLCDMLESGVIDSTRLC